MTDPADLFVAALAREMADGDRVFIGINQPEVALAAHLARRLWAPSLRFWASGEAAIDPARSLDAIGRRSFDNGLVAGRSSFFWQARAFDEMGPRSAVCFAGGLQVDGRGNANLAGIPDGEGWVLRGPGSAGLPSLTAWAPRFYLIVPRHDRRSLVERCAAISVLGDPTARAALGMAPGALAAVITPLARFEPTPDGLVLTEITESASVGEIEERTGFAVRAVPALRLRPALTEDERRQLEVLRAAAAANRAAV